MRRGPRGGCVGQTHKPSKPINFVTPPSTMKTATAKFTMRLQTTLAPVHRRIALPLQRRSLAGSLPSSLGAHSQDVGEVHVGGRVGEMWEPQFDGLTRKRTGVTGHNGRAENDTVSRMVDGWCCAAFGGACESWRNSQGARLRFLGRHTDRQLDWLASESEPPFDCNLVFIAWETAWPSYRRWRKSRVL